MFSMCNAGCADSDCSEGNSRLASNAPTTDCRGAFLAWCSFLSSFPLGYLGALLLVPLFFLHLMLRAFGFSVDRGSREYWYNGKANGNYNLGLGSFFHDSSSPLVLIWLLLLRVDA